MLNYFLGLVTKVICSGQRNDSHPPALKVAVTPPSEVRATPNAPARAGIRVTPSSLALVGVYSTLQRPWKRSPFPGFPASAIFNLAPHVAWTSRRLRKPTIPATIDYSIDDVHDSTFKLGAHRPSFESAPKRVYVDAGVQTSTSKFGDHRPSFASAPKRGCADAGIQTSTSNLGDHHPSFESAANRVHVNAGFRNSEPSNHWTVPELLVLPPAEQSPTDCNDPFADDLPSTSNAPEVTHDVVPKLAMTRFVLLLDAPFKPTNPELRPRRLDIINTPHDPSLLSPTFQRKTAVSPAESDASQDTLVELSPGIEWKTGNASKSWTAGPAATVDLEEDRDVAYEPNPSGSFSDDRSDSASAYSDESAPATDSNGQGPSPEDHERTQAFCNEYDPKQVEYNPPAPTVVVNGETTYYFRDRLGNGATCHVMRAYTNKGYDGTELAIKVISLLGMVLPPRTVVEPGGQIVNQIAYGLTSEMLAKEKEHLERLTIRDVPFVTKLLDAFHDEKNVYFVMVSDFWLELWSHWPEMSV